MNFNLLIIVLLLGFFAEPNIAAESNSPINTLDDSASGLELKTLMSHSELNLSTYKYWINTTSQIDVTSTNPSNESNLMVISIEKGVVNLTGRSLSRIQKFNQNLNQNNITSTENEIYVLNDTMSTKLEGKWTQRKLQNAEVLVKSQNIIRNQSGLLNNSKIDLLGFEKVEGQECYLVRVKPDKETFVAVMQDGVGSTLSLTTSEIEKLYNKSTFTWNSWITKDSHLLKKNDIKMMLTLTPALLGMNVKKVDESEIRVNYSSIAAFSDFNETLSITPSNEFKSAYPFPLHGSNGGLSATIFGVIRDDGSSGYGNDDQKFFVDMAATGKVTAHLVDIDDRFYEAEGGSNYLSANERGFLVFKKPVGTKIKKIRFEPYDDYNRDKGAPFSLDLILDSLGSTIRSSKDVDGQIISDRETHNNLLFQIYYINRVLSRSPHLDDLSLEVKVTNNGTTELDLNLKDFSLIDQHGWEYTASEAYTNQLGTLLPGESRRFDVAIEDVSELSDLAILKYKDIRISLNR